MAGWLVRGGKGGWMERESVESATPAKIIHNNHPNVPKPQTELHAAERSQKEKGWNWFTVYWVQDSYQRQTRAIAVIGDRYPVIQLDTIRIQDVIDKKRVRVGVE